MRWNWQLPDWPNFKCEPEKLVQLERQFLLGMGSASACLENIDKQESHQFIVEILSVEGVESSKIEGELLDRESLQSSIQRHFGFHSDRKAESDKEARMAELLCSVYDSFDEPLTHNMLFQWHETLFGDSDLSDKGKYRTHPEPTQIVSNRSGAAHVYFEAPPSAKVPNEMKTFIAWFNETRGTGSILVRAAIAHVYFESIHPFEDGNGRIGRLLVEKVLSQGVGHPVLIAISKLLEKRKKEYYSALENCNRTLSIQSWVEFFSEVVLQAHKESMEHLYFLIEKSRMFRTLAGKINPRQEKVLLRMFAEGPSVFKGGLTAEKYIKITKAPRATATRDLTDLVEKGALVKTGELRHTRYHLNINLKKGIKA